MIGVNIRVEIARAKVRKKANIQEQSCVNILSEAQFQSLIKILLKHHDRFLEVRVIGGEQNNKGILGSLLVVVGWIGGW